MANNDKILIDGIIDERVDLCIPSNRRDEAFEYFSIEQILKDYAFSKDEILEGVVDGKDDGGIDAIYIVVNGHLITDIDSFLWPKSGCELEVYIITCKHHDTFKLATVDSLVASVTEYFDFGIDNDKLTGDYNEDVLNARTRLVESYRKVSTRLNSFALKILYASRGDSSIVGENIVSRSNQLTQIIDKCFSNADCQFIFFGSTELIEAYRKSKIYSFDIKFHDIMSKEETYLLLVGLKDYYDFISDEDKLKRYFFDSNVRSFMGLNNVNSDIQKTLNTHESPDFWWLNNGITILTTNAAVVGNKITIENVQIVNGLQTTESIFRYFSKNGNDDQNRSILIKVIVSNEKNIRDQIIRATNNQTAVEQVALHATDKIQQDIEDVLLKDGLYYERRTNHYLNQGINPSSIFSPLYVASGFVSLILKMPWTATHFKTKFLRREVLYNKIFVDTDLKLWPQIVKILKKTDSYIESTRPAKKTQEHYLRRYRHLMAIMVISNKIGTISFNASQLISLDINEIDIGDFEVAWKFLKDNHFSISTVRTSRKKPDIIKRLKKFAEEFELKGFERIKEAPNDFSNLFMQDDLATEPSNNFLEEVKAILPSQPWDVGMHKEIVSKLKCTSTNFFAAVEILIENGEVMRQKDGVLFNQDGSVHSFDPTRVDPETLKLL